MKTYVCTKHSELALSKDCKLLLDDHPITMNECYTVEQLKEFIDFLEEYLPHKRVIINELNSVVLVLNLNNVLIVLL